MINLVQMGFDGVLLNLGLSNHWKFKHGNLKLKLCV